MIADKIRPHHLERKAILFTTARAARCNMPCEIG